MDEDMQLDYSMMLILLALMVLKKKWKSDRWRRRRWYIRPINRNRLVFGEYYTLWQELKHDPDMFIKTTRMDLESFNYLLLLLTPLLTKNHPKALPAELRLYLTLK